MRRIPINKKSEDFPSLFNTAGIQDGDTGLDFSIGDIGILGSFSEVGKGVRLQLAETDRNGRLHPVSGKIGNFCAALRHTLQRYPQLKAINFGENKLCYLPIEDLATLVQATAGATAVDFSKNEFCNRELETVAMLSELLRQLPPTVIDLNLSHNWYGSKGRGPEVERALDEVRLDQILVHVPPGLQILKMERNLLGNRPAAMIAQAFDCLPGNLKQLYLHENFSARSTIQRADRKEELDIIIDALLRLEGRGIRVIVEVDVRQQMQACAAARPNVHTLFQPPGGEEGSEGKRAAPAAGP